MAAHDCYEGSSCLPEIGITLSRRIRFAGVLGVVKHQHIAGWCLSGDHTMVLGHEPCTVHLSFVVDLNLDLNLATYRTETSKL